METSPKPTLDPAGPIPGQILQQLDRILASPSFRTSKRCSDLLRHVVEAACQGRQDFLKERTLGIAVFDRDPDYDTNQDPVVRNTAGQVRKRLAQYYMEPGHDRELRIELPAGAYIPHSYQPAGPAVVEADPGDAPKLARNAPEVRREEARELEGAPETIRPAGSNRRFWWLATGFVVLVGIAALMTMRVYGRNKIELFWAPILRQPGAVVLCVGQGHTYKLKGAYDRLFEGEAESPEGTIAPAGTIPLSDVVPIWDRAIGINDAQSLVRLTALFAGLGKAVEFRGGRSTSLGDLRGRSSVLIGAFNNSWTLSLTGELRFYFDDDTAANVYLVRDRLHPQSRAWEVRGDQQPAQDYEDYALVSRVFNPTTEQAVIVAAGIKGGGTAAAGEFLTNPSYLGQALQNAPRDWEKRNVQIVLKTRIYGGAAGPPQVVASHYW